MKTHVKSIYSSLALFKAACFMSLFSPSISVMALNNDVIQPMQIFQNKVIKGRVVDSSGESIIGANVMVKGTSNGTITDMDGGFTLSVSEGSIVVVSYIGYKSREVNLESFKDGFIQIELQEDTELIEEVVVVGYGVQKKATLTGSVSQVGGEDLKKVSATNLSNTLAGKTAGIIANTRTGEPGEDYASILIRGKGTLGDTSPLIVVDGIAGRSFSNLNPEDIETISVLKDASAAIYGARAANGVILVTTKRGKQGNVSVNYSGSYGISQPTRIPDMLNAYQYATYINEYDADQRHGQAGLTYSEEALEHYLKHDDPINYPDTNWWDAVAKDWAERTQHSVSVSGGNDNVSFYTSAQYLWQDAIYKNSAQDYKQYQIVSNLDAKVNKSVRIGMDILLRQEQRDRGVWNTNDLFPFFISAFPASAPYYPNGLPRVGYDGVTRNAAIMVSDIPGSNNSDKNIINIKPFIHADLDFITKGLYTEGYAAIDYTFNDGKQINKPFDVYFYDKEKDEYVNKRSDTGKISLNDWSTKYSTITLNVRLGYDRTFKEFHKVNAFVAYEQSKYNYHTLSAYRTNYLSDALMDIFAGSDVPEDKDNGGSSSASARVNFFGRINYSYKDKYLFETTIRHDGSMNFAKGRRWGTFPSISAGWIISEENFFKPLKKYIEFFKLKGSWGQMGNDNIAAYQYLSQYAFTGQGAYFGTGDSAALNKGFSLTRTANPLVTWETANTTNLGFNATFFDGHLSLDFDWFKSKRRDILITRNASIPSYTGLVLPSENLGKVNNSGVEIVASYRNRIGDFDWNLTGNFTYAENKVVYMDEAISTPEWQRTTNNPIDGLVMYKAIGIYQTKEEVENSPHLDGAAPGDLIYEDTNNDGTITWDDAIRINESATPKIMYGFTFNGSWKGIDLNVFFQGQAKAVQLVQPAMNMPIEFYNDRWRTDNSPEENLKAKWPKAFVKIYGDTWNGPASTWWLRSADFLRLKSVELGYTFPKSLTSRFGINKCRIYVNGNNLFTIDKFGVCDPEVGAINAYPLQRMLTIGTNISF